MNTTSERYGRVLMIAFHVPPWRGSSGSLRTLSFARHLPEHGWEPVMLTAHPRAYPDVEPTSVSQIPANIPVTRAFALDAARHLSINGRYFDYTALPDRWSSWLLGAIPSALLLIRHYKPRVLWSTYPISTAHVIGALVHRITGIPWVADFRDPMVGYDPVKGEPWPSEPRVRKVRMWVERIVMKYSTRVVFVTPGARQMYAERFPQTLIDRLTVIPNGYDEDSFIAAEKSVTERQTPSEQVVLLHSGGLYPGSGRDTAPLFAAVAALRQKGLANAEHLKIILRASADEDNQQRLIAQYGIADMVFLEPPLPYTAALTEMLQADGLLLFQGALSQAQIPAKVYEYLRAQRPIFALVDPSGDAAVLLRNIGVRDIHPFQDHVSITNGLTHFIAQIRSQRAPVTAMSAVTQFSRQARTRELARVLTEVSCS